MEKIMLDCSACKKEKSMNATEISRFNSIIRLIGYIIVIPSVLGVALSAMMFYATVQNDAGSTGAMFGANATIGFGMALFVGASSLVAGLVGWILLLKKKVFKCINCGFIIDRD